MAITDDSVETFLEALASRASTPGGGSAAAILGAMGAALAAMVANLTIGKKKYAEVEGEMVSLRDRADALRGRLVAAVQEDVTAFDALMQAMALPRESEAERAARQTAMQSALEGAMLAPLHCARLSAEVIELAEIAAERGSAAMVSDGGVAALAGIAALRASALNVYVNAKSLTDRAKAEQAGAELRALMAEGEARAERTFQAVSERLQS
jgi:methenyltetrahydrofolate cyclohydrolase